MYFGWYIVGIAAIVYGLILGTTFSAFGLFVLPVSEDLKLSRADMNTGLILLNLGSAALAPIVGRMLDWMPARRIMMISALLFGASFMILSLSNQLWLNILVLTMTLAAAVQGGGTLTMSVLLARWFTIHRGRAMMLAFMGSSLGSIIIVPAIGWTIEQEGWRMALMVMGVVDMVALLLLAMIVRERPRVDEAEVPVPEAPAGVEQIPKIAETAPEHISTLLRMPQFWCIGLSCALALAIIQTILVTIVPFAIEAGLTAMQAAGLISITGGAAIASKLLLAIIADRIDRIYLLAVLCSLGMVVNVLLIVESDYIVLVACAVMLGIASSAISPILYALLADRFGLASFGTVRGLIAVLIAVFGALAVRSAGEVYDRVGNYDYLFFSFIAVGLLAVGLMLATRLTRPISPIGEDKVVQS